MATQDMELNLRHDEPNLARLNLILAPNRTDLFEWQRDIAIDALGGVKIVCTSPRGSLVPHGVDNDILLGLVNAAILQGLPQDDTVRVSTRELLKLSGITPSARAYKNLRESLRRLQHTAYDVTDSWYDGSKQRWRSVSFSLIVKHWAEDNSTDITNIGQWRSETLLAIKLDDSLIQNIRSGHILPLDFELLSRLTQPLTRNVFRTLSFQRSGVDNKPISAFTIPLVVWASHLGMQEMRPDTVMRSLKPAHEELVEVGFLSEVSYQGRGKQRVITYVFGDAVPLSPNPEAVALLTQYGISGGRALTFAQTYPLSDIQRAISVLKALLVTPYGRKIRNKAGILSDILISPDKYDSILIEAEGGMKVIPQKFDSSSEDTPQDVIPTARTAKSAHVLLLGQYDQSPIRREMRDAATELYVAGVISTLELITLIGKNDEEAQEIVAQWQARPSAK